MLIKCVVVFFAAILCVPSFASQTQTNRIPQFNNDKVTVWETVIQPGAKQILKMHRHEHDRVVVAFDDGILKVTNDKNHTHLLKLQKGKALYLTKDVPNEMHTDENMTSHPIKVLVIELANA